MTGRIEELVALNLEIHLLLKKSKQDRKHPLVQVERLTKKLLVQLALITNRMTEVCLVLAFTNQFCLIAKRNTPSVHAHRKIVS